MRTTLLLVSSVVLPVLAAGLVACSKKTDQAAAPQTTAEEATPTPVAIERLTTPTREGSSVVLGKLEGKKVAFVADDDTGSVRMIDLVAQHELGAVVLGGRPGQMVLTKSGQLAVALRDDASVALVDVIAGGKLVIAKKTPTAGEPVGLALAPDDATLFVATGYSHALQAFHVDEQQGIGERTLDVPVEREARAVSIASDGKRAFVAHAASSKLEVVDIAAAKIAQTTDLGIPANPEFGAMGTMMMQRRSRAPGVIFDALIPVVAGDLAATDTAVVFDDCFDCGNSGMADLALPQRFARQSYALAHVTITTAKGPEEVFVIPHTEVMTGDPMVISSGYGGGGFEGDVDEPAERFTLSMVDVGTGKRKLLSQTGDARSKTGCHLPRGAATDGTGNVYVACFGSDLLMAFAVAEKTFETPVEPNPKEKVRFTIDQKGDVKAQPAKGKVATIKSHYLAMTATGSVTVGAGPSGVAVDLEDRKLVSFSQLDGALSVVKLDPAVVAGSAPVYETLSTIKLLRASGLTEQVANGRKLFSSGGDAHIAKDGRACSSCHPDGRDDGLVWSTPEGPRQTIMLAGRVNRPGPFGWLGKHPTLQVHMTTTMKNLKGTGLDAGQQDALAAYLVSLRGPAQKWRTLTDEETHGRDVFNSGDAQCASCHAEKTGFTDHDTHDVRSATTSDQAKTFLVPSLQNVGGSAPYFHDGRYASLDDLIEKCDGSMGATKQLNQNDKKALAAYLRTL